MRFFSITTISKALLLCAGLGTRLRPFTERVSKPLIPVMGVPVVGFAVEQAKAGGVSKFVANVHHLADATATGLRNWLDKDDEIRLSDERGRLLGSAGGIRAALPLLSEFGAGPFFALNGDVLCEADLRSLGERHAYLVRKHGVRITLLMARAQTGGSYRRLELDAPGERVVAATDQKASRGEWFFTGTSVIDPSAVESLPFGEPSEFVPSILLPEIAAGRVGVAYQSDPEALWLDVGDPQVWAEAHFKLLDRLERQSLPKAWDVLLRTRNRRIASRVWLSREAQLPLAFDAAGPSYWSPFGDQREAPLRVRSYSVGYGCPELPEGAIGLEDLSVQSQVPRA